MDVPRANVFCPSVDVHILCHAKQTRPGTLFDQVKAVFEKVVCCYFVEKLGNH